MRVSSIGKTGDTDEKTFSSSKRTGKSSSTNEFSTDKNGFETSADSDTSSNTASESQSESESTQATEDDLLDKAELESTKNEIYSAVRQAYQLTGQERKKTVKKLLLKWHPDKNPGRERFAAEVFKHLRKQIDHFENDPLTSFFNTFNNFQHTPFSTSDPRFSWNKYSSTSKPEHHSSSTGDDRFGSFDNLNKDSSDDTKRSYQDIPSDPTADNDTSKSRFSPHRSSSFRTAREEWQYRRQHGFQRRHGFFTPTEESNSNGTNSTTNGTNSQSSTSTGGSKFNDLILSKDKNIISNEFACSLHTHRFSFLFFLFFFIILLVSDTIFGECSLLFMESLIA